MASKQLLARIASIRAPGGAPVTAIPAGLRSIAVEVQQANAAGSAAARQFARKYMPILAYSSPEPIQTSVRKSAEKPRVVAEFADGSKREWVTSEGKEGKPLSDEQIFAQLTGLELPVPKPKGRKASSKRATKSESSAVAEPTA